MTRISNVPLTSIPAQSAPTPPTPMCHSLIHIIIDPLHAHAFKFKSYLVFHQLQPSQLPEYVLFLHYCPFSQTLEEAKAT